MTARATPTRREQILDEAARLFAAHGFHGVSIDGLGAAVGISGPALYRHFPSKEGLLVEMLVGISEHLLARGRELSDAASDPRTLLDSLVDFHVGFALEQPELISVQDRDLSNLPDDARHRVRALQRRYVEIWEGAVALLRPDLPAAAVHVATHAAFGLMNSTPRSAAHTDRATAAPVLTAMARAALG